MTYEYRKRRCGKYRPADESDMQAGQMTADDYAWFTSDPANGIDFCLTFVHGLEPDEILARFDGTEPVRRTGTDPDRLAGELARVGFEPGPDHSLRYQQRTLALTEHLTGIRLTPDLLDTTMFRCSAAPVPRGPRPTQRILAAAHQELKRHAEEPGRDELLDFLWAERGVTDKRLRASGHLGVVLYTNANDAFRFLATCDDTQLSEVIRWGRERVFAEAELTNQSWFEPLRQALLRGEPISAADRDSAERHLDPDPGLPPFDTHGRVLLGARQHAAMGLLDEPEIAGQLAVACRVAIALGDVFGGRSDLMVQELLHTFPGVDDA
jgi:hypothetical protein